MNPWLETRTTPFGAVPFNEIHIDHYLPAITQMIERNKKLVQDEIVLSDKPATFENTLIPWEAKDRQLDQVVMTFFNLNSAETNDRMQELAREISPILAAYANDLFLDEKLFARIKSVYDNREKFNLDEIDSRMLEDQYKAFVRNGALLDEDKKSRLRDIDAELSKLSLLFGENVLKDTNDYFLHVTDKERLRGLPESSLEAAASTAKEKGLDGWVFTLHFPSLYPFMKYCDDRKLRREIYEASMRRGLGEEGKDNRDIISRIVELRHERAQLLGYNTHADYVLEERMAQSVPKVTKFLNELYEAANPVLESDFKELADFKKKITGDGEIQRWDYAYWSAKLKKEKFSIDDELLKPYFQLDACIDGMFEVAKRLYGVDFQRIDNVPVYHPDVRVYEVRETGSGDHVGLFYADFFPRPGKRSGAWMTMFREQYLENGKDVRPHVGIVCNFTKPTQTKPSLLSFVEAETMFHEFGHSLHGLLSKGRYASMSTVHVYWDFVELPSQIMENWLLEKECLDIFARHYETGDAIPVELIEKIRESSKFHEAYATMRQLSFAFLDMAWHTTEPNQINDVIDFEENILKKTDAFNTPPVGCMSCGFSHIFAGGYSAGYYSYKWAELLDADAFEYFKEKGIFDEGVATSFRENILSQGNSAHPMELYKRFRGQEPSVKALLKRGGLVS
jgi:Zn-dependent oligopeptidase